MPDSILAGRRYRDLKPYNVVLTAEGVAQLCDLGTAKQLAPGELARTVIGSAESEPRESGVCLLQYEQM